MKSVSSSTMIKLGLAFLPFLFVSCATITRGVHEKLYVESQPAGANVLLSTGEKGVTPTKFVKSRRDGFSVTVSKPGYKARTVKVESKASPTGGAAMAGNAVAGGLIGIAVDSGSGALFSLYPNPVSVRLVPSPGSAPKKRAIKSAPRHVQDHEVKLPPRTSRPSSGNAEENDRGSAPNVPASTPPEQNTLQSVESPQASPAPH